MYLALRSPSECRNGNVVSQPPRDMLPHPLLFAARLDSQLLCLKIFTVHSIIHILHDFVKRMLYHIFHALLCDISGYLVLFYIICAILLKLVIIACVTCF